MRKVERKNNFHNSVKLVVGHTATFSQAGTVLGTNYVVLMTLIRVY